MVPSQSSPDPPKHFRSGPLPSESQILCRLTPLLQISRAPGHVMHDVHFALQPRNMDTIKEIADAVSDPT